MTAEISLPTLSRDLLTDLQQRFGLAQWMLTRLIGDQSMVLICVGDGPVAEGDRQPWVGSIEAMIAAGADAVVGDVSDTPFARATSPMPDVGAVAGVTVRDGDGVVWGTLIGYGDSPADLDADAITLPLSIAARSLSLVLNSATAAAGPSPSTHRVDIRKDPLTGVLNDRGWLEALTVEDERCRRYGNRGSVAIVRVDGFALFDGGDDEPVPHEVLVRQTGEALRAWRRGADVIARLDDNRFAVMLVEVWEEQAVSAIERMREVFTTRRIDVSLGLSDNSARSLIEAAEVAAELAATA